MTNNHKHEEILKECHHKDRLRTRYILTLIIIIKYMLQGAGKFRGDGKLKYGGNLTLQYPNTLPPSALIYRLANICYDNLLAKLNS